MSICINKKGTTLKEYIRLMIQSVKNWWKVLVDGWKCHFRGHLDFKISWAPLGTRVFGVRDVLPRTPNNKFIPATALYSKH